MSDRPEEMDERDVDERFASIVAAWDTTGERPVAPTAHGPSTEAGAPEDHSRDERPHDVDRRDAPDAGTSATEDTPGDAAGPGRTEGDAADGPPTEGSSRQGGSGTDADSAAGHGPVPPEAAPGDEPDPRPWVDPVNPSPVESMFGASSWRTREPSEAAKAATAHEEEHYDPPAVQLPPQEDLHFWGAVLGLVAGPLMLLWVAMARPFHSTRWFVVALLLSLGGFALLVLRQPRDRDGDDDGARV